MGYASTTLVFPNDTGTQSASIREAWEHAVKRAEITNFRFHDLRHTAATWALRGGMSKERVSRMLGHSGDNITSIYEHLNFEDVAKAHAEANPLRRLE